MSWLYPNTPATADSTVTQLLPPITYADTLESRCAHYRRCGMPAWIQPEPGRIMLVADRTITSVTMRAELGVRIRHRLRHTGVRVGPIALHARSKRWSFLVHPDLPADTATYAALFRLSISLARPGAHIALPAPTHRHIRSWIQAPTDGYRPHTGVVLDAIRACTTPPRSRQAAG